MDWNVYPTALHSPKYITIQMFLFYYYLLFLILQLSKDTLNWIESDSKDI